MINGCFLGFASIYVDDTISVFSTMDGDVEAPTDADQPAESSTPPSSDIASDVVPSTDASDEVSNLPTEESSSFLEENTTEVFTEISSEVLEHDTLSGNEYNSGTNFDVSASDYSTLIEVVSKADKNNVDTLSKIDFKVNAILFVLLLFWAIDRIKKIVRGFESDGKYHKSNR